MEKEKTKKLYVLREKQNFFDKTFYNNPLKILKSGPTPKRGQGGGGEGQ